MDRERFEELVAKAYSDLPDEFLDKMDNIDVVVQDYPTPEQLQDARLGRGRTLLGLYEGVPRTKRSHYYGLVVPDKITLFQKPIESICRNSDEIVTRIGKVLRHEIAHHFGISDARLQQIERDEG